ncbi:recombination protein NinB [Salmonella enterica]
MKATFYLRDDRVRENLIAYIRSLPVNDAKPLLVAIGDPGRTLGQNDLFHALCGDVARQIPLNEQWLKGWQWKNVFVSGHWMVTANEDESPLIRGIENEWVNVRESTSRMGKRRMASLIEYTTSWAAQNGVRLYSGPVSCDYFGHRSE